MISGVFGLPGAGKTTFLTWIARRALQKKPLYVGHLWGRVPLGEFPSYKRVYTTFPVHGCFRFDYENTVGIYQYENCLILIDEMSHVQDNRDYKNYTHAKKYWWSMLRHMKIDLVYCSQSYQDCDKKIQNMTTSLFLIEKRGSRSRISPVVPEQLIQHHEISVGYSIAPWICRTTLNRKKLYQYFDSFDFKRLPPIPAVAWDDL